MTPYNSISKVRKSYTNQPATPSEVYINGTTDILGNPSNTSSLNLYLNTKKINGVIVYLASLLDDAGKRASMRDLNTAWSSLGIANRSANVTQSVNAINIADLGTPGGFNTTCTTVGQKFTSMTSEIEWWKPTNPYFSNFDDFIADNILIYDFCQANNLKNNAYIARFKDGGGSRTAEYCADWCVAHYDVINLVDYVSTEKFITYKGLSDGIKTQLILMGEAAKRIGKVQKFNILFASEGNIVSGVPTNMKTWFDSHPLILDSYDTFTSAYNSWTTNAKTGLKKSGQNIYAQEGLRA